MHTFPLARTAIGTANLFTQTASATVANTTAETALSSTGEGSLTLPANYLRVGRTIRVKAWGYHSSTAGPTIRIRIKLGSTTVLDTTAINSGNGTNKMWTVDGVITCRTTGGSGTVFGQGFYAELHPSGTTDSMVNTGATTVDTTATQAISVTAQWGTANAGNTITCTNLTVETQN